MYPALYAKLSLQILRESIKPIYDICFKTKDWLKRSGC